MSVGVGRERIIAGKRKTYLLTKDQTITAGGKWQSLLRSVEDGFAGVHVGVRVTYHSGATTGARILLLHSFDGEEFDTDSDDMEDIPFTAGKVKQKTFTFPLRSRYYRVVVENLDTAQTLTLNKVFCTEVS